MKSSHKSHRADFVVVGSGIAGLRAAIELSAAGSVLVLAKSGLCDTSTPMAIGGIALALSDEDEISLHEQDTLQAGDGLCRLEAVKALVQEGPAYINELIEWGTKFDRGETKLAFTREAAHSKSRVLHTNGGPTGGEIIRTLLARAHCISRLHLRPHSFTTELIVERGRVTGLRFVDEIDGSRHEVRAAAILLGTGGLGQIYRETTNAAAATGDGTALAYEAGAALTDLEFVQFYPTALAVKDAPRFPLPEALRQEGGILRNVQLERFMKRYNEAQELAPAEILARDIVTEMHGTRSQLVYLDMTAKSEEFLRKRFPRVYEACLSCGLDLASDLAPVCPAAHFTVGGIKTDLWGRTSLPGLYAAGETAATGVHGANRLPSNSLLEGLVFGARAGQAMSKDAPASKKKSVAALPGSPVPLPGNSAFGAKESVKKANAKPSPYCVTLTKIRELMWHEAGILRSGKELATAMEHLQNLELPKAGECLRSERELRNIHTLAILVARSALAREESRGSHYRSDFPYRNDEDFARHSILQKGQEVRFES
jgi:L-aspartate oxidase